MDTLVYMPITPAHEANADGNIAAVWCFKDAAKSKMRVTRPLHFGDLSLPYLQSFANWSLNRQNLCINNSQTRSSAVANKTRYSL